MAPIPIKLKDDILRVEARVEGLKIWQVSYVSSFNGESIRNADNNKPIQLGRKSDMVDRFDNWEFSLAEADDKTKMVLEWYQGENLVGTWSRKGKSGQVLYVDECFYKA